MNAKAVGVKALRDNLSKYLREVRAGTRIYVLDRDEIIAELHEPETPYYPVTRTTVEDEMIRAGDLIPPKSAKAECGRSPVHLPAGTSGALLEEDRTDAHVSLR